MDFDPVMVAQAKVAFAALCGGIVRLLFRPAATVLKSLWLLFACVACGYYFTPPMVRWLDLHTDDAGAIGALLGFVGLSFAQGLLQALDRFDFTTFFQGLLTLFLPKKKD